MKTNNNTNTSTHTGGWGLTSLTLCVRNALNTNNSTNTNTIQIVKLFLITQPVIRGVNPNTNTNTNIGLTLASTLNSTHGWPQASPRSSSACVNFLMQGRRLLLISQCLY